jgi:hypothetical protein
MAGVFFRGRRKQMGSSLKRWRGMSLTEAKEVLDKAGIKD